MLPFKAPVPAKCWIIGCEIMFLPNETSPSIVNGECGDGRDGIEIVEDGKSSADAARYKDIGIVDALFVFNDEN